MRTPLLDMSSFITSVLTMASMKLGATRVSMVVQVCAAVAVYFIVWWIYSCMTAVDRSSMIAVSLIQSGIPLISQTCFK